MRPPTRPPQVATWPNDIQIRNNRMDVREDENASSTLPSRPQRTAEDNGHVDPHAAHSSTRRDGSSGTPTVRASMDNDVAMSLTQQQSGPQIDQTVSFPALPAAVQSATASADTFDSHEREVGLDPRAEGYGTNLLMQRHKTTNSISSAGRESHEELGEGPQSTPGIPAPSIGAQETTSPGGLLNLEKDIIGQLELLPGNWRDDGIPDDVVADLASLTHAAKKTNPRSGPTRAKLLMEWTLKFDNILWYLYHERNSSMYQICKCFDDTKEAGLRSRLSFLASVNGNRKTGWNRQADDDLMRYSADCLDLETITSWMRRTKADIQSRRRVHAYVDKYKLDIRYHREDSGRPSSS